MTKDRSIRIHLGPAVLDMARAGRHNFLNRLCDALAECGYRTEYRSNGFAERLATGAQPGWSMFEMEPPEGARSLVFRRACVAPFWQIDATDRRKPLPVPLGTCQTYRLPGYFRPRWPISLRLPNQSLPI